MNRSGEVLKSVLQQTKTSFENVIIVFDNLDLELGTIKLKIKGSSGGHNGLESLIASAKTENIKRLGIGIGRPKHKGDVISYVLGTPERHDAAILAGAVKRAALELLNLSNQTLVQVMNQINRRNNEDDPQKD